MYQLVLRKSRKWSSCMAYGKFKKLTNKWRTMMELFHLELTENRRRNSHRHSDECWVNYLPGVSICVYCEVKLPITLWQSPFPHCFHQQSVHWQNQPWFKKAFSDWIFVSWTWWKGCKSLNATWPGGAYGKIAFIFGCGLPAKRLERFVLTLDLWIFVF